MDAMLSEMTMSEYIHWQAIYSVEPFPEERADRRAAEIIQAVIMPYAKKIPDINELMPDWWGERQPRAQTPEQMKAAINTIKAVSRKKKHGA